MSTSIIFDSFGFAFSLLLISLLTILFRVFMTLAIYYDIKANNIKTVIPWIVASIFVPIFTYIVFKVVKKDQTKTVPKLCVSCNATVDNVTPVCPYCGNAQFVDYVMPENAQQKKKGKNFYRASLAVFLACLFMIGNASIQLSKIAEKLEDSSSFDDFVEDFDNEFDDDFYSDNPLENFGE